jgi:hypothetical protein
MGGLGDSGGGREGASGVSNPRSVVAVVRGG